MNMKFLKVPRKLAEQTRQQLMEKGIISPDYDIFREGEFVFIPVTKGFRGYELVERKADKKEPGFRSLAGALSSSLDKNELEQLTTSFDILGDIAIVEIPRKLEPKETEIGNALLRVHKNVRAVFKKLGPMEGEYRVRRLARIAGKGGTETLHREHGCRIRLDAAKVYFSVRLSHERKRIAGLVQPGENVLVMFAGVGPFALLIAREKPGASIVAVESNPAAARYLRENIALNKSGNIIAEEGDVRDIIPQKYRGFADRVVMPLPKTAHEFLDMAFAASKRDAVIHFYTIAGSEHPFEDAMARAEKAASRHGVRLQTLGSRIVRPYSPELVQVVLDLRKTIGKIGPGQGRAGSKQTTGQARKPSPAQSGAAREAPFPS
ncbi:tRNA (guanine-N1)-methyltransferase [Candidatus Micrarchaeota archaeon]|nr:tRNA (guanine-N1)-methyltransferase [Candidatus Micrarchaeota archaeon]